MGSLIDSRLPPAEKHSYEAVPLLFQYSFCKKNKTKQPDIYKNVNTEQLPFAVVSIIWCKAVIITSKGNKQHHLIAVILTSLITKHISSLNVL